MNVLNNFSKINPATFFRKVVLFLTWRIKAKRLYRSNNGLQLHIGCGDRYIGGMLNCDYRATKSTDAVIDCGILSKFSENSISLIFSNAFFEHLYRHQQITHLRSCYKILHEDAPLVYLGIPDFEVIAASYINRAPGILYDVFDLYYAYRYTHGDPEHVQGWWIEQLHKSLFDKRYIEELLCKSGFNSYTIFNYCYPGEAIPLNIGIVAWKNKPCRIITDVLFPFRKYIGDVIYF